jgi:D-beta-D-heptose 7-phosphate kinase/D-beta-D-heptose 1-phosphate adenosyltransferase
MFHTALSDHEALAKHAKSVIVIGDVMLDRYWYGDTTRISPEAPVPVVQVKHEESRPGGAANVALNLAHLGAKVTLIGVVGKDEQNETLKRLMGAAGVTCRFIEAENSATITKLRILAQHQQLIRTDFEHAEMDSQGILDQLMQAFEHSLGTADAVVLSDYGKGCLRPAQPYIQAARAKQIPIVVDPKGSEWSLYEGATVITPNSREFEEVVGKTSHDAALVDKAKKLIQALCLDALLITRGAKGMALVQKSGPELHIPTQAREVFDVTGAGDTVVATLALCLANGASLYESVPIANLAAGIVVAKLGTATVSLAELREALHLDHQALESGIVTRDQLIGLRQRLKTQNKRVVMTNGCFDLLHPGHLQYLQAARRLGDCLIIAVNDDASVTRLKGESRPINTVQDRMLHLAALGCVDWVVPFSEDTPGELIEAIMPDVLVKGGDYQISEIVGAETVANAGGEVKVLPFKGGYSSTLLIQKILSSDTHCETAD